MKKIVFTGGGSAGHVIPNLALIEQLQSLGNMDIAYIGTDGIEKRILAPLHIPYHTLHCPKFARGMSLSTLKNNLKIPFALHRAKQEAVHALKMLQPDVIFSKGGYVALPVLLAARKLRIPCFAHESDFSPGLTNRLTARFCKKMFTSFPETAQKLPHGKYCGALLRPSLFNSTRKQARASLSISEEETVLLIIGGGSGSQLVNQAVRNHLKTLLARYTILHVCGKGNVVDSNFKNYHQFEFIADMGSLYEASDLILSRAGSGAVFEILAFKKPSILIPLEHASRGDQVENAKYFAEKGLCHILRQTQLDTLPTVIEKALTDQPMRLRLENNSFTAGNERVLEELLPYLT